jgi:adenylate kinase
MNSIQKTEYLQEIHAYLEEKKAYLLFEDLLQSLVMNKPEDPLSFLIDKLEKPKGKVFCIIGPPNCKSKEITLKLKTHFKAETLITGDLLRKEVVKGTEIGESIEEILDKGLYVSDEIVSQIIIQNLSKIDSSSAVFIEGFPKTMFQYKLLLESGILPSNIIRLDDSSENKTRLVK